MTTPPGSASNPLRVAIVGSGPAGFYAASQLLSSAEPKVTVDLFDRLPTPWGLVRFGVAPDHPKIKSVSRVFERTARMDGFRFHGNVEVGRDLSHEDLASVYHAVLYAVGTPDDRGLGVPGEDLAGSESATAFVAWYNGHPDYAELDYDLSGERAVVVGNGNVALDVARMLALSVDELSATDVADHALAALSSSKVREIVVLGRRGPVQAAFTTPELRELGELELVDVIVDPVDLELDSASAAALAEGDAAVKANYDVLRGYASRTPSGKSRRIYLRFCCSPLALEGSDHVERVVIGRNELVSGEDGALRAQLTSQREVLNADLVFRSIGYVGRPLPGIPFDERRKTFLNATGRVLASPSGVPLTGVYVAGWVKRGPSGVIGTNKKCAQETTAAMFEDFAAGHLLAPSRDPETLLAELRSHGVDVVDYAGWQAIDAHERALGESGGRPRVKLVDRTSLIAVSKTGDPGK